MSERQSDLWPALAALLAVGCCLGLPLLVASGVDGTVYLLAGIAGAAGTFVAAAVVLVWVRRSGPARRRRTRQWRVQVALPARQASSRRREPA